MYSRTNKPPRLLTTTLSWVTQLFTYPSPHPLQYTSALLVLLCQLLYSLLKTRWVKSISNLDHAIGEPYKDNSTWWLWGQIREQLVGCRRGGIRSHLRYTQFCFFFFFDPTSIQSVHLTDGIETQRRLFAIKFRYFQGQTPTTTSSSTCCVCLLLKFCQTTHNLPPPPQHETTEKACQSKLSSQNECQSTWTELLGQRRERDGMEEDCFVERIFN